MNTPSIVSKIFSSHKKERDEAIKDDPQAAMIRSLTEDRDEAVAMLGKYAMENRIQKNAIEKLCGIITDLTGSLATAIVQLNEEKAKITVLSTRN